MQDKVTIQVNIAGNSYDLKVERTEIEAVENAVVKLNKSIKELLNHYSGIDKIDAISMVSIQLATELEKKKSGNDLHVLEKKLNLVEQCIDKYID